MRNEAEIKKSWQPPPQMQPGSHGEEQGFHFASDGKALEKAEQEAKLI